MILVSSSPVEFASVKGKTTKDTEISQNSAKLLPKFQCLFQSSSNSLGLQNWVANLWSTRFIKRWLEFPFPVGQEPCEDCIFFFFPGRMLAHLSIAQARTKKCTGVWKDVLLKILFFGLMLLEVSENFNLLNLDISHFEWFKNTESLAEALFLDVSVGSFPVFGVFQLTRYFLSISISLSTGTFTGIQQN